MIRIRSRRVSTGIDAPLSRAATLPLAGLIVSVAAVLVSQFALDGAADSSLFFHWMQHGLLFSGGVGVGVAACMLRNLGQSRA